MRLDSICRTLHRQSLALDFSSRSIVWHCQTGILQRRPPFQVGRFFQRSTIHSEGVDGRPRSQHSHKIKSNHNVMLADLRLLNVPTSDTPALPSLVLQFGPDRYLFNAGEGTTRSTIQRKGGLSRVSHVFVPRVSWEAIGGLPGTFMSMADGWRSQETVHGPQGLGYAIATMRCYAKRDTMNLDIDEIQPRDTVQSIFQDQNIEVHAVTLYPDGQLTQTNTGSESHSAAAAAINWESRNFNPTNLQGQEANDWIRLVSKSLFTSSRLVGSDGYTDIDVEMDTIQFAKDAGKEGGDANPSPSNNKEGGDASASWRPPRSPAFVMRMLPPPSNTHLADDGKQSTVLAFICEAHSQRGKFDPAKAAQAGVPNGPLFSSLTRGQEVTITRPKDWLSLDQVARNRWMEKNKRKKVKPNHPTVSKKHSKSSLQAQSKPQSKPQPQPQPQPQLDSPKEWDDTESYTVKPNDVMGPSRAGAVFFQIYLPSVSYLASFFRSEATEAFQRFTLAANQSKPREQRQTPHVIVHVVPNQVLQDPRYQAWMCEFGPDCNHIVANYQVCANKLMFPSASLIPLRLSRLDSQIFNVPQYQTKSQVDVNHLFQHSLPFPLKVFSAEADQIIQLHPRGQPVKHNSGAHDFDFVLNSAEADKLAAFQVKESEQQVAAESIFQSNQQRLEEPAQDVLLNSQESAKAKQIRLQQAKDRAWSEYLEQVDQAKQTWNDFSTTENNDVTRAAADQDLLITTLGTGSALPSKYRNVISTLIQTPHNGNILLDAGESTYDLLRRKFGSHLQGTAQAAVSAKGEAVEDILRNLRILFISHIHADHHIGLIRILSERRKLDPKPKHALYLVGTGFVNMYLKEYEQIEKLGLDEDVILLESDYLDWKVGVDPSSSSSSRNSNIPFHHRLRLDAIKQHKTHIEDIKKAMNLEHLHTARVVHRGAHCFGIIVRHRDDWSLVFSGDTGPCTELVGAGQNATILIHEASLEDSQLEMAAAKGHSTFGQAVEAAKKMKAKNLLLTHFSQRYPKMSKSLLTTASSSSTLTETEMPIALAFDLITYPLSQFKKFKSYIPAMQALFSADFEEEEEQDTASLVDVEMPSDGTASMKNKTQVPQNENKSSLETTIQVESNRTELSLDGCKRPVKSIRKTFKPSDFRYIGLRLQIASSSANTRLSELISKPWIYEVINKQQLQVLGEINGSFGFDLLGIHSIDSNQVVVVLRVQDSLAQQLATTLALLPSLVLATGLSVRTRVDGPVSSLTAITNQSRDYDWLS